MPFDYDCEATPTPDKLMQGIMDVLGDSYSLRGSAYAALIPQLASPLDSAALTIGESHATALSPIFTALQSGGDCVRKCRQSVATQLYAAAGQGISASTTCRSCCDRELDTQKVSLGIDPSAIGPVPPLTLSVQGKSDDDYKTSVTTSRDTINVTVTPAAVVETCPKPTTLINTVYLPTVDGVPVKIASFIGYCDRQGHKLILPTGTEPPLGWTKFAENASAETLLGEAYSCVPTPGRIPKEPIFNKPSDRNAYPFATITGPCADDAYTGKPPLDLSSYLGTAIKSVTGTIDDIFSDTPFSRIADRLVGFNSSLQSSFQCSDPAAKDLLEFRGMLRAAAKTTGIDNQQLDRRIEYWINKLCPTIFPSVGESLSDFLAGEIDVKRLKEWVEINGHCWEPFSHQVEAARSKYSVDECIDVWRRFGYSPTWLYDNVRKLGVLDTRQTDTYIRLRDYVPTLSQIVRYVANQTPDDEFARKWKLDEGLTDQLKGDAKKWQQWNFIPDEVMKNEWRAHWQSPGLGTMEQLFFRTRLKQVPAGQEVTVEKIRDMLELGNVIPWWNERILENIYHPISRWDLKPAYNVGIADDDYAFQMYARMGYSDDDCKILVDHLRAEKDAAILSSRPIAQFKAEYLTAQECEKRLNEFGYSPQAAKEAVQEIADNFHHHSAVRLYTQGFLTYQEVKKILTEFGLGPESIIRLIDGIVPTLRFSTALHELQSFVISPDQAEQKLVGEGVNPDVARKLATEQAAQQKAQLKARCIGGIKKRFDGGELDEHTAANELQLNGIEVNWARELSAAWQCERRSEGKEIAAGQLCTLIEQGLVSVQDSIDRLVRMGYTADNAELIAGSCLAKLNAKATKEHAKQIAADAKAYDKFKADQAANATKQAAAAKRAAKATAAARKAQLTRTDNLLRLAAHYAKKAALSGEQAAAEVLALFSDLSAQPGVTQDEAIHTIARAIDLTSDQSPDRIAALAGAILSVTDAVVGAGQNGQEP